MHMCTLAFGVAKKKREKEKENESIDIRYIYSIHLFRVCTNIPSARGFSRMIEVNYYFLR